MIDVIERLFKPNVVKKAGWSGTRRYIDTLPSRRPFALKYGVLKRGRDYPFIANAFLNPAVGGRQMVLPLVSSNSVKLMDYEDRRRWHPEGAAAPAGELRPGAARWIVARPDWPTPGEIERFQDEQARKLRRVTQPGWSPFGKEEWHRLGFSFPRRVVICLKRSIRREVLHAMGVAGGRVGKPHFNEWSKVRC